MTEEEDELPKEPKWYFQHLKVRPEIVAKLREALRLSRASRPEIELPDEPEE